jgi:hypothetical protein
MTDFQITKTTNLTDLEQLLREDLKLRSTPVKITFSRQRKHQFFKDPALAQFCATIGRHGPYTLVDWHNKWLRAEALEHYGENLAGLSAASFATTIVNTADEPAPVNQADIKAEISKRHGLLKPYGDNLPRVRELAFLAFDPEPREPNALAGLVYDQDGYFLRVQTWKEKLLDLKDDTQQDLFSLSSAPRPIIDFLHELYQNGYEHGNKDADNNEIPGVRSVSLRRHNPGSTIDLKGFADGFKELEDYLDAWCKLNRGTAFYEVSVNDVGLGIIDRFLATRPEFASEVENYGRLAVLLRILLTPHTSAGSQEYAQALSSKDVGGQERGSGRGLERALTAVKHLNGFVSLRTGEFWLYRSFPTGEAIGDVAMHEVQGGPFAPVAGTCFTALFPINLRA